MRRASTRLQDKSDCVPLKKSHCYRHECTYLLTAWSRVLLEKLTGFAANQEIPRILWNPKVHHRTHKRPPPVPVLSQFHPVPTTPSHFLKIHLNIIHPSTSWSPQWSLSLRFPHQNLVHTYPFLHTCHNRHDCNSTIKEHTLYWYKFFMNYLWVTLYVGIYFIFHSFVIFSTTKNLQI